MIPVSSANRPREWSRYGSVAALAVLFWCGGASAKTPSIRGTAQWLVDLGRDYALSEQVTGSDDDGLIILSYMQAASRIDEAHADAYLWQYDMLKALGRGAEAREALRRYAELRPADVSARLLWSRLSLEGLQTAEARTAFCREWLAKTDLPRDVRSELQLGLAQICFGRMDEEGGSAALADALAADPQNVVIRRLMAERAAGEAASAPVIHQLLGSLEINPLQPELVWAVGQQLNGVGLHDQASEWYERSLKQSKRIDEEYQPPSHMLVEMSTALAGAGRLDEARATCRAAIDAEPRSVAARLTMVHIARMLGRTDLAAEQLSRTRELYEQAAAGAEAAGDGARAAEIALYYAYHDPQPAKAAHWANLASQRAPDLPLTKLAAGFVALSQARHDEAMTLLEPYAGTSQVGAIGLARALIALERKQEAVKVLQAAGDMRRTGVYFAEIVSLLDRCGEALAVNPRAAATRRAVETLDTGLFDPASDVRSCIKPVLMFEDTELTVAEPWRCRLTLTNTGERAIHLGEGGLLGPQVLLGIRARGDRERSFPAYLWLSADLVPILRPGQTIEVVQTIDVGPLRRELFRLPQTAQHIELTGILDAVRDAAGQWVPSIAGRAIPTAKATRLRVSAAPQDIARFTSGLHAEDAAARIESATMLASLLIEQQMAEAGSVGYERATVDSAPIILALLRRAAGDPLPHVRARVVDALRWYRLSASQISSLAALLSDRSWLVRMAAYSVLAEQQQHRFLPVLERVSRSDPDPLLRQLTGALARRIASTPRDYHP